MILEESLFICPVCRQKLFRVSNSFKCLKGHSFDISKEGYVNLLMDNSKGKRHGDDRLMVAARKSFLDKGYYSPLKSTITELAGKGNIILDSGCGEGYYTQDIAAENTVCGIDISKDALKYAAKRCKNVEFAVASISDIPLKNSSVDTIINIFAPDSAEEFLRILKPNGSYITAIPMENHLFGLKSAIYDNPYKNPAPQIERQGFMITSSKEIRYSITLESNYDIESLFKMTPYYYKTSKADQQKLSGISKLTTEIEFFVAKYEKL